MQRNKAEGQNWMQSEAIEQQDFEAQTKLQGEADFEMHICFEMSASL